MSDFKEVLIVAGTHGNELSGIYLEKWIRDKQLDLQHQTFTVNTLLANPEAILNNVRFIDADLNRQFGTQPVFPHCKESQIAQQLQEKYSSQHQHFVIDLHNTTQPVAWVPHSFC